MNVRNHPRTARAEEAGKLGIQMKVPAMAPATGTRKTAWVTELERSVGSAAGKQSRRGNCQARENAILKGQARQLVALAEAKLLCCRDLAKLLCTLAEEKARGTSAGAKVLDMDLAKARGMGRKAAVGT